MAYNATAYKFEGDKLASTEAVELDDDGTVIRACGHWCALNGTKAYEAIWISGWHSWVDRVHVVRDGADGYRNAIGSLALPPAYAS
jgi:hypothetical protein